MQSNEPLQTPIQPEVPQQSAYQLYAADSQVEYGAQEDGQTHLRDQPQGEPLTMPVSWQAAEYIQGVKSPMWYIGFFVVVTLLTVTAVMLHAWTFVALIVVMAIALMVYSHRPARILNYAVSEKGLHINDTLHPLGEFKSFGVMRQEQINTLVLTPVRRFRPALTVYFPTDVGERIVDTLGGYIPMKDVRLDTFDVIVQKLRL